MGHGARKDITITDITITTTLSFLPVWTHKFLKLRYAYMQRHSAENSTMAHLFLLHAFVAYHAHAGAIGHAKAKAVCKAPNHPAVTLT